MLKGDLSDVDKFAVLLRNNAAPKRSSLVSSTGTAHKDPEEQADRLKESAPAAAAWYFLCPDRFPAWAGGDSGCLPTSAAHSAKAEKIDSALGLAGSVTGDIAGSAADYSAGRSASAGLAAALPHSVEDHTRAASVHCWHIGGHDHRCESG